MIQIKLDSVEDLQRKKSYIWGVLIKFCETGGGILQLVEDIRSILQNKKMWPMLQDYEDQAFFYGDKIKKENWKVLLLSAWRHDEKQEAPVIWPGLRKEPVIIFKSSAKSPYSSKALSKKDFCSFVEFLYAEGITEHGIKFTDKAMEAYATYREALE
jgi:hypothetical protein